MVQEWKSVLKADPLDWLLEEKNPSVRYFTLRDILGYPEDSMEVISACMHARVDSQSIFRFHKAQVGEQKDQRTMKLFNQKKSKESVSVNILHKRPDHPKNVTFMNTYRIANNPELDLKRTMHKAFNKAHPNWKILEINLRKEKGN